MKIIEIETNKLISDPNNARKHGDKNMAAIKGSLAKFGQQKPIVITEKNIVLAGNGTLEAAKQLGWPTIKVVVTDLDKFNSAAYALADNRTAELAEWDDDILGQTLQALYEDSFDIESIGFTMDYLESNEDDEQVETNAETPKEYLIVIECTNEIDQQQIFEELKERNINCKIMS